MEEVDMALLEMLILNKKKTGIIAVTGILAASLIIAGCTKKSAAVGNAQSAPPEVNIVVVKPQRVALSKELPGRTSAYFIAEVRPQVSGIIQKRLFTEGAMSRPARCSTRSIRPPIRQLSTAQRPHLLGPKPISYLPGLRLSATRILSRSMRSVSRTTMMQVQRSSRLRPMWRPARAAVETARINLAYTKVTAPISGRIGRSTGDRRRSGDRQSAGRAFHYPAAQSHVCGCHPVQRRPAAPEAEPGKRPAEKQWRAQARVKLLLEDGSVYPLPGTLKFSEVTVDQSTGSITLRAIFPNPKQTLLPGMFVRAIIEEGVDEHAILVPQRGVTRNPAGDATVMVVGNGEKVEPQVIKVVRTVGDNWLVSDGLKTGDRVILEGIQKVRPERRSKPSHLRAKQTRLRRPCEYPSE